jgi:spore coat-associated protein N
VTALTLKAKLFATVAAVGTASAVAGLGTFGTFTDTTNASTPVDSGIVDLNLGAVGAANRLTVAATDIVPGDTIQRAFTLSGGTSTSPLGSVTLTTEATTSSLLDTDATNGLQMVIEKCSLPTGWLEVGTAGSYTYTCPLGTVSTVVASRAVIGEDVPVTGLDSLVTAGATDALRLTLTFPSGAGNSFQDKASTVRFTFDATQRAATSK